MKESKKGLSKGAITAMGVGAAAAAVAAGIGAYWFYSSANAAKHRKAARSWMLRARADVLAAVETAIEQAGKIDKETYMTIVGNVVKGYSKVAGVTAAEVAQVTHDMKAAWLQMQKAQKARTPKKTIRKASKKTQ